MSKESKITIGRGGHGEVYYFSKKPNIAYKQTHYLCKDLKKEYNNWNKSYQKYIVYTSKKKHLRNIARILRPSNWSENNSGCVFQLAKVTPIKGLYTWQAYIGDVDHPNLDYVEKRNNTIRGRYMGPEVLSKYFDVEELAYAAGILIGIVHYGAKLDGTDVELVLGKTGTNGGAKMYLIDFDQTSSWADLDEKKVIGKLS